MIYEKLLGEMALRLNMSMIRVAALVIASPGYSPLYKDFCIDFLNKGLQEANIEF